MHSNPLRFRLPDFSGLKWKSQDSGSFPPSLVNRGLPNTLPSIVLQHQVTCIDGFNRDHAHIFWSVVSCQKNLVSPKQEIMNQGQAYFSAATFHGNPLPFVSLNNGVLNPGIRALTLNLHPFGEFRGACSDDGLKDLNPV